MEGGRFESYPEPNRETIELQRNPEQVFDSDRGKAEREALMVQELLSRIESMHERHNGVEVHIDRNPELEGATDAAPIKIVWCDSGDDQAMMLQLDPIVEGHGVEGGIFGYKGSYGLADRTDESFKFSNKQKPVPIEELFGCPNADLRVKPTVERWAIGKDELSMAGGANQQTLYMGLGFLMLGEEWMYIGMHEGGHYPNEDDENKAWRKGKIHHAKLYKDRPKLQRDISIGNNAGLFGSLKKPRNYRDVTVGRIERYGITSHFLGGNADIPRSWQNEQWSKSETTEDVMRDFRGKIEQAQYAFDEFFQR